MAKEVYRNRLIDSVIKKYLSLFKAVCIEGPKASGKTWAAKQCAKSEIMIGDPSDSFANRRLASLDVMAALRGEEPHLIDEWQEVPAIWDAVRAEVDKDSRRGRFILTGSSTPDKKGVLHSGTGRITSIQLRPMSLYESGESSGRISLSSLFEGEFEGSVDSGQVFLTDIAKYIVRGGWPAAIDFSAEDAAYFVRAYIDGIISEDVPRVAPSTDLAKITRFMRSLARNESTTASRNTIRKDFNGEISDDTASSYTTILTRLFQLDDIPPYSPEVRSSLRVKQMSKHHYVDPSIPSALLRLNVRSLMNDLQTFGFLFKSLALRDLLIYSSANGFNLYHYQDYRDNEVDAVVEAEDGSFGLIEIKLGTGDIEKGIKSLLKTNKALIETSGKGARFLCVLSGLTPYAYKDKSGVIVVPLTALRP